MKILSNPFAKIVAVTLVSIVFAVSSYAQTNMNSKPVPQKYIDEIKMVDVRDRAVFETNSRLAVFVMLAERLKNTKRITAAQRTELISQVQTQIANLDAIKTNLGRDKSAAQILSRKQAIVLSYKPYAFLGPKVLMLAFADRAIDIASEMKPKTTDAVAQTLLADVDVKSHIILSTVGSMQYDAYPGNRDVFVNAQKTIGMILQDLQDARKTIR